MSLTKTYTSSKKRSATNGSKNSTETKSEIILKTKTSGTVFPKKVAKLNKLLSKAKLIK